MKVLCTGISGINKLKYAEEIKHNLNAAGHTVQVYDAWTYIKRSAEDLNQPVTKEKILDRYDVDQLRALAFERICQDLEKHGNDERNHSVILTHACFRWNKYLRSGFDVYYLNKIDPTFYVNVLDGVSSVHKNLEQDSQWKGRLRLDEIATWRDEETFLTEVLAQFQKKKFYLIPVEELSQTLTDLLLEPSIEKIYLSYPITAILKSNPKLLDEARNFAETLRRKYIVFNPLAIKDLMGDEKDDAGVLAQLRHGTVWRDFKLIDQSDMVVVYYPVQENSPGANREIFHGYTHNKDVYLYCPHKISPFWDPEIAVTKWFEKFEDLRDFLLSE